MASTRKPAKSRKVAAVPEPVDPWAEAVAHLRAHDEKWAARIDRIGPCLLRTRPDRFATLVRAIVGQQISAKAATSIDRRLRDLAGETHRPDPLIALGEAGIRSAGLSGVKARYVLNLSEAVRSGSVPIDEFHDWEDEAIIRNLTAIKGVGTWTAEMFLIFGLGRADILSPGDLGIRVGLRNHHGLDDLPDPKTCRELTEALRPYRSVAMWYLWNEIDGPKAKEG